MSERTRFSRSTIALGIIAIIHGLVTWPIEVLIVFIGVGASIAFLAELIVIQGGLLTHHIGPKVMGVPIYVLFGWIAVIYVALRISLVVSEGIVAALFTAILATTYDILVDHHGVDSAFWTYTDDIPGPRHRSVPWWNFAGWFAISFMTALVTVVVY